MSDPNGPVQSSETCAVQGRINPAASSRSACGTCVASFEAIDPGGFDRWPSVLFVSRFGFGVWTWSSAISSAVQKSEVSLPVGCACVIVAGESLNPAMGEKEAGSECGRAPGGRPSSSWAYRRSPCLSSEPLLKELLARKAQQATLRCPERNSRIAATRSSGAEDNITCYVSCRHQSGKQRAHRHCANALCASPKRDEPKTGWGTGINSRQTLRAHAVQRRSRFPLSSGGLRASTWGRADDRGRLAKCELAWESSAVVPRPQTALAHWRGARRAAFAQGWELGRGAKRHCGSASDSFGRARGSPPLLTLYIRGKSHA